MIIGIKCVHTDHVCLVVQTITPNNRRPRRAYKMEKDINNNLSFISGKKQTV